MIRDDWLLIQRWLVRRLIRVFWKYGIMAHNQAIRNPFLGVSVPLFVNTDFSREPIKPTINLIISDLINTPRDMTGSQDNGERAHFGVDVPSRAVSIRVPWLKTPTRIRESRRIRAAGSFEVRELIHLVAASNTTRTTGLPYSPRRWSNVKPILWILFHAVSGKGLILSFSSSSSPLSFRNDHRTLIFRDKLFYRYNYFTQFLRN